VNVELDLDKVISKFKNAEYDSAKFNCVRVRDWANKCTVAIFASGKLQVTGASNPEDARRALKFVAYRLKNKIGYSNIVFSNLKIDNILATFDIGTRMDLYGISRDPEITCTYMPSQFAAAVVREVKHGVVIDVFASGKMNIKGKDSLENICVGVNELMPKIAKHICASLEEPADQEQHQEDSKKIRL
jgi:TATA-box binding protein (TBP) (component of TFIID and TFIIIB)